MTSDLIQILIYCALIVALTPLVGRYMARIFAGERTLLSPVLAPVERGFYGLMGVKADAGQHWTRYAAAMLAVNAVGWLILFAILRLQHVLPWNPQDFPPMSPWLAFNTTVSFVTNTNWQAYGGETTLSYFSQMAGLTVQNFVSAGTGIAVAIAVIRGFVARETKTIGNFYVDLTRSILYLLLPLSILAAIILMSQGVIQNLSPYLSAQTVEGGQQMLAQGPAASQVAIKQLGTNGGGFFNMNSAHPFENPTPLSNLLECVYILLIPAAFCYTFGKMARDLRQGWAIFAAMGALFLAGLGVVYGSELSGNTLLNSAPIDQTAGYMEGKEVRFGTVNSTIWATATTAASNGSVNAMHDSLTPLGGLIPLFNMAIGEVVFGGVGAGFYGMLVFVVLTVFIAGLMVGRTPEYLGKKIEAKEIKLSVFAFLAMPLGILGFTALTVMVPSAASAIQDPGPHGLSEVLYAYGSATGNNGSAFAGFGSGSAFHTTCQGLAMLLGRYAFIIPMLAVAGSLAAKKAAPATAGTFPTHTPLFVGLLIGVIVIIGGLTFFPAFALGPIAEHVSMIAGQSF